MLIVLTLVNKLEEGYGVSGRKSSIDRRNNIDAESGQSPTTNIRY